MKNEALYSSKSEEWETPQDLFDRLNKVYRFKLDACATKTNAKCRSFFSKTSNGLLQDWTPYKRVWLNPPYGRPIGTWMRKAYEESQNGCLVACLVPARTDTKWWHEQVLDKGSVTFVRGRLKFKRTDSKAGDPVYPAPFPSAIVIYRPDTRHVVNAPKPSMSVPRANNTTTCLKGK